MNYYIKFIVMLISLVISSGLCADDTKNEDVNKSINPKLHEYLQSVLRLKNDNTQLFSDYYAIIGRIFELQQSEKLTNKQFAEQIFLSSLEFNDDRGSIMCISLMQQTMFLIHRPTPNDYLEALAPYIEGQDPSKKNERARVMEIWLNSSVLNPAVLFTESDRRISRSHQDLQTYLEKHSSNDHPNLLTFFFTYEPSVTFETLIELIGDRIQQKALRQQRMELQLLIDTFQLAIFSQKDAGDTKVVEVQSKLKSKFEELAVSPQWCMRALVVVKYAQTFHDNDLSLIEKLSKDNHPVVARLAKSLLPERSSGAASNP